MHDHPLVSVLMPVCAPDPIYFVEAVRSVLGQTYGALELVVVERPSGTSAEELLRQFADPRVHHHVATEPTSLVSQLNQCIGLAAGPLLARMDADDICHPDRLSRQVDFMRSHDEVAVLGSQIEIIGPKGKHAGWRRYPCDHQAIVSAMTRYNAIAHPSVMVRRATMLACEGYRGSQYPIEDYELWSRLARLGYRLANHSEPLLRYRLHRGSMKATRLRSMVAGTLEVKQTYWGDRMDWQGRLRMRAEGAVMALPPSLAAWLFRRTQYQSRL